jgi:hypothetical protein
VQIERATLPPPPGLIASLAAGFDSVANSITVIALPVLFDLFLWFGPHLRLQEFLQPTIDALPRLYSGMSSSTNLQLVQQLWSDFITRFNLFTGLRTFPVGISSLMTVELPMVTPLGKPFTFDTSSLLTLLGWGLLVLLLGWLTGALYFHWVSKVALKFEGRPLGKSISQTLVLSIIWLTVLFVAILPVMMLISVVSLISAGLGQFVLILVGLLALWLLIPVYFSAHGIFTFQLNAVSAILNSLRMVRYTLPATGLFLLMLFLISQGLRFLWTTPSADSWWTLVGILGHAFVSTALLAASFIYYRNVNEWLKVVFEKLRIQKNTVKA